MRFRVLGPLEIERDGQPLGLGGAKQRAVLAVLVLRAREVVPADRLADAIWEGAPPPSVETTLRSYVSNLRKVLEPDRPPGEPPAILRTTSGGYVLDVADEPIDARRFEQLVRRGRERRDAGQHADAVRDWTEALRLWRGEAFQDFAYNDFFRTEASRLDEIRLTCLEELFDARLELGEHDAVVGDLEAFCAEHPERDRALWLRMLALYRCRRQTEALEAYEQGRRRMADDLGIDPSPELRELHERIVRQDPGLGTAARDGAHTGRFTLTFLLGDVELSTERLRTLGDGYASILSAHRLLLRQAFESHGGRGVRAYGDETFAAFDCATDAVAAAVAAQLALVSLDVDAAQRLPVRMGVHTGEATFSDGEPVGLSVHLAARIMAAAHGAQVLVSQATKDLYEAEEGAEVSFVDTGTHVLKDIREPVRLFQVVHPGLRREFPRLRTRLGRTDNLPQRDTSFVGRARDLAAIEADLAQSRVVTLTGVGGVGKTRLAMEAGRRLVARYPDGVWFCELASVNDEDGIVHTIATALGVDRRTGTSMRDSVLTALAEQSSLLILDNCEHLLGPVADLVEEMARTGGTADVLATSREALGVEGERSRPVRSLAATDRRDGAVRLFADRAQAVRPDFLIDDVNAADIEEICRRLDGIPLAIELAAARVAALSPGQIANRLDEGFHFLRSGRRAAVDRHRTLHGAIDWSYAMLSDVERLLFDRLSVFAGGFTLEAAEEVCARDLGLDVADGLASLVAKSLIDADPTGPVARYSMLETMRQYAQDRLAERPDVDDILRAHATYFHERLDELSDVVHVESEHVIPWLTAEFDNLRAAQAWAVTSGDIDLVMGFATRHPFFSQFHFPETWIWADDAIAMPGAERHDSYPRALMFAATREARLASPRGMQLARKLLPFLDDPDDQKRIAALMFAAALATGEGRLEDARRFGAEYTRLAELTGAAPGYRLVGMVLEGMTASHSGDHAGAMDLAERATVLARDASTGIQAICSYFLGEIVLAAGEDLDRARECLDRSIRLSRANGMHFWIGVALVALASLRARHGDPDEALEMFDDLIDRWRRLGDWARQWITVRNLVELFERIGADEVAATLDCAAEATTTSAPSIGAQGARLEAMRVRLAERMGPDAYASACARGRAMSDRDAVAFAKTEIDRALQRRRSGVVL